MKKHTRLDDTAALRTPAKMPEKENESCSVDVRRIDNGYVVRESHYKDGSYSSKETFSSEKPVIENMGTGKEEQTPDSSLRDAMDHIR